MLLIASIILTAAVGIAKVGKTIGDYTRRQITADAAALSAADLLAQRMRHIGRLQEKGMQATERRDQEVKSRDDAERARQEAEANEDWDAESHFRERRDEHDKRAREEEQAAKACSEAARRIAAGSSAVLQAEIQQVGRNNGAIQSGFLKKLPAASLPNEWFIDDIEEVTHYGGQIRWIRLNPQFPHERMVLAAEHRESDGAVRHAVSASWLEALGGFPTGPITQDDWKGRRVRP